MSFLIKDDGSLDKYNELWDQIKEKLNIKFYSMTAYDEKCIKAKSREFNGVIETNFLGDEVPRDYNCIACIAIDSAKKNYPEICLEECKYRPKKIKMTRFIDTELELESEPELESDIELDSKLESDSDSE